VFVSRYCVQRGGGGRHLPLPPPSPRARHHYISGPGWADCTERWKFSTRAAAQGCLPRIPRFVCCRGPPLLRGRASVIISKRHFGGGVGTPHETDLSLARRSDPSCPAPGQADEQLPKGVCRGSRASFAVGSIPSTRHAAPNTDKTPHGCPRRTVTFWIFCGRRAQWMGWPRFPGKQTGRCPRVFADDPALRLLSGSTPSTRNGVRNNFEQKVILGGCCGPRDGPLACSAQRPLIPGSGASRRAAAQGCLPMIPHFVCCRGPPLVLGTAFFKNSLLGGLPGADPNEKDLSLARRSDPSSPVPGRADEQLPKGVYRGSRASFAVGVHPFYSTRGPATISKSHFC
jgi:hypothetical protein